MKIAESQQTYIYDSVVKNHVLPNEDVKTKENIEKSVHENPTVIKLSHDEEIINEKAEVKEKKRIKLYVYLFMKRTFDIFASFFGLILLSPIFFIIIIAIKIESEGKAIYKQRRIGINGKVIKIYKFRSMVQNADEIFLNFSLEQKNEFEKNFKLINDPRITNVGAFIRKTSLDELPQLLNILTGTISIVGPRPIVEYETYKYKEKFEKFISVKPGLTGYWQINGRNDTSYDERIEMDMYYINNRSILLDIKIFIKTFKVVLSKKGAC